MSEEDKKNKDPVKTPKEIFKSVSAVKKEIVDLPVIPDEYLPKYKVIKSIKPSKKEIEENKRARSAKLRIIERIG